MPNNNILAQFANVFQMPSQEIAEKIAPDFNRYYRRYLAGESFDPYLSNAEAVITETGWDGDVLDVGCGFGVFDICLHASGARSVTGTDLIPEKIIGATRLAELMGIQNVKFTLASAEQLPFSDSVFDGVLIKDTASHLPASTCCYAEVFRVLKPGGSLLIIDDRNSLNPLTRWHTKRIWKISEFGGPEQVARLGLKSSLSELRLQYIREHFPELSDQACRTLAIETRGLLNGQIAEFVAARDSGSKPPQQYAQCINPENAMIQERLLNPFHFSKQLRAIGFETKVLPPLGWRTKSNLFGNLGRMIWPISATSTAYFQILAARP
jgi:ubiquinone/menaquinone biosynthesis C-methylase UbiE